MLVRNMNNQQPAETTTKQHANHLFTSKAGTDTDQSQDLTLGDIHLDSYINTQLTDDEILNGDPKLITQERVLQVSATHTAEEIARKVNTGRNSRALTPSLVYHRIHTACQSVASRHNTSFDMVKTALNNARLESGVKARINATLGRAVSAEASMSEASGPSKKEVKSGSDVSTLTSIDDSPSNYLGDFFSTDSTLGVANPLFRRIAKGGGSKLPENEDILRLAAKYTVLEMVEMVQNAHPELGITNTKISARIMDALSLVASSRGLGRDAVKHEFELAKAANGVKTRHYGKISKKRKATTKARKEAMRHDSVTKIASPEQRTNKRELSPEDGDNIVVASRIRPPLTPSSDVPDEEDTPMTSDSDDDTVAWVDSPTYAKYKPRQPFATPGLADPFADVEMDEGGGPEECLTDEEAAMVLMEMRFLDRADSPQRELSEEGAALILLKIQAEAQNVMMDRGVPSGFNH